MKYGTLLRLDRPENAEAFFAAHKAKGYDCCHLVYKPDEYRSEDAAVIASAAQKHGVDIPTFFAGYKDSHTKWNLSSDFKDSGINSIEFGRERIEYVKRAAEFCVELGVKKILIHAGFVANSPFSEEYIHTVNVVRELALFLKERGLLLILETGGESPITLLRLIKDVDTGNVFVNLDTGNIVMYGFGNPVDAVYTLHDYIRSVHIKDGFPPIDPDTLGKEADYGAGFVNFDRVFSLLKKYDFGGEMIIEREIPDGAGDKSMQNTHELLKKVFD